MSNILRNRLWWLVLGVSMIGQAFGQGGATGAIDGSVQDASGAVVANAEVKIINQDTGTVTRATKTDATGSFTATLLPVGSYTVNITSAGFREAKIPDITVRVTETTRMTAKLVPLQVLEKIEVQALVQSVETTTATTGQAIEAKTIRDLPLATQNFQQLLTLSSGAQSELNASAQLGRGNVRVIVNGQREDNNNYLIEGISATDYNVAQATNIPLPNPDVIQEFKVQTSLYDASQGRNGGGNVNAIMKTGTKNFHGDVYEFFRNDVLNANEYFLNAAGQKRPPVKQNIFGGSFGGPIGKEAQAGFFFLNYQGTRQRSGLSPGTLISTTLPVIPASIRDDATLDAAIEAAPPNIRVPSVDPVIHKLLLFKSDQFGPAAGGYLFPALQGNLGDFKSFIVSKPGKYTEDQFTANWDREFRGGNDKLSARFFFSNGEQLLPFGAGGLQASLGGTLASSISAGDLNFPYDIPLNDRFFSVNETHLFSPAVVNDFRFGFVRINNSLINQPPITADDLGIDRPTSNVTKSIYKFSLSSFQMGPTPPADQFQIQNNYNFVDTLSWVKGAHSIRLGGDYTRVNLDKKFPQVFNGQLFFGTTADGESDFQHFLEGSATGSFGGGGVFDHKYRNNNFGFFVQDDWKARPDLTLNLGLRTEIMGAFYDDACHIGNFDPQLGNSGQYPFVYGKCASKLNVAGLTGSGNNTTYKNNYATGWGPRVGFAWDVLGRHHTTLRGGYGIYYVREDVGTADQLSFQAPFLPIAGLPNNAGCLGTFFAPAGPNTPPQCLTNGANLNALPAGNVLDPGFVPCLGALLDFPGNDTTQFPDYGCANGSAGLVPSNLLFVLTVPRHFITPSTQQWNLTVQRDLGRRWVLEIGYVGTHSLHLRETSTNIQAKLATVANPVVVTAQDGTPFQITNNTASNGPARSNLSGVNGYGGFQIFANDAYSHYNSLQTTLSRRWGAGYFQAAYTFSKSLDATSTGNTALNTAFNDESNIRNSYGLADFDRKHRLSVSYNYDLPIFKNAKGAKGMLLSNWTISGVTIFQSGTPFSVLDSAAGSAYLATFLSFAALGADLAPGRTIATGLTHGDIHQRLNGYVDIDNFQTAPPADQAGCDADPTGAACTTRFGTLHRNIYRGPFQQNWDFSLIKHFRVGEKQDLRFTADFFNLWNHANFNSPTSADVENRGAFGKINSTVGTPRLIQLSLRYAF
jgi:hypothetical protein